MKSKMVAFLFLIIIVMGTFATLGNLVTKQQLALINAQHSQIISQQDIIRNQAHVIWKLSREKVTDNITIELVPLPSLYY